VILQAGEPLELGAGRCEFVGRSLRHEASFLHHQNLIESAEEAQAVYRGDHPGIGEGCE
jgi:hypothetical protein